MKIKLKYIAIICFGCISLAISASLKAQKYDFVNFTIEQGLVQSQANNINIDNQGFLWVSTLGGISRFNGKEFKNFNYSTGLLHSLSEYVFGDSRNRVWMSTIGGVQIWNGKALTLVQADSSYQPMIVNSMLESKTGEIYVLSKHLKLFKYNEKINKFEILKTPDGLITAFTINSEHITIAVFKQGLYKLEKDHWSPLALHQGIDSLEPIKQIIGHRASGGLITLTPKSIYKIENNKFIKTGPDVKAIFTCMHLCGENDFFIGTTKGAIYWDRKSNKSEAWGRLQGFTDNAIVDITSDKESNIWLASDGEGVFRLRPNANKIFDISSGMTGNIIMAITKSHDGDIITGALEHGLNVIKNGKVIDKKWPSNFPADLKINSLLYDYGKNLWVGGFGQGLWKINGNKAEQIEYKGKKLQVGITAIHQHTDSSILFATPRGILSLVDDKITLIKGINHSCFSIYSLSQDTILIGSTKGLFYLTGQKDSAIRYDIPVLNNFLIGGITQFKNLLAIGTSENGLYFIDKNSHQIVTTCNETQNLSSNIIFSLLADGDELYVGTTHGLNKVTLSENNKSVQVYHYKTGTNLGPECNQNGILKDADGKIWLGTTKGLYIYDISKQVSHTAPAIYLKSIELLARPTDSSNSHHELLSPDSSHFINLKHSQNHLLFHLQGLHLSSYDDILYQYYLEGAEESYSAPQTIANVVFPNLAPGEYTFKAKAILGTDPTKQSEAVSYSFFIAPPFYKTSWFRMAGVFSLLLIGAFVQRYRMHLKAKQIMLVNEVRKQEQIKIQQRTSEDLHDDLGNKITRLALLTDILETKVSPDTDQQKLLNQIRENIQGLYFGTKDIIWALAPNHHTLYDTIERIHHFGIELFQESGIEFHMSGIDESLKDFKPPFEFSRNLIMICKEGMHNVLKHSGAKNVSINLIKSNTNESPFLELKIADDGKGFDMEKITKGNGLENMHKRATRLGATISISKGSSAGSEINVKIKIPQSEG